ncbi:MAG TPA: hypothetical protein GXX40_06985 [Firmicutes bacterium]|nr:hypothetical protein [Bacillota bacterium]
MALTILLVSIAVSFDSFLAGISLGLQNIKLPLFSQSIIAIESGGLIIVSTLLGHVISSFLTPWLAKVGGACLLVALGAWSLVKKRGDSSMVSILAEPDLADVDYSGTITAGEAAVLGVALGLDSFAMGLSLALAGMGSLISGLACAAACFVSMVAGTALGTPLGRRISGSITYVLPGVLMIMLGISRIL